MEKTGDKVWEISINKVVGAKSDLYKNGINIEEFEIIGVSNTRICINSDYFTTFYIKEKNERKSSWKNFLNEVSVKVETEEDYFGKGVFIKMYSTKKPTKSILNKMLKNAYSVIDSKYGFLFTGYKTELNNAVNSFK